VGEFQRVVASPTPLLLSCKGNISCPSAANTNAEYAQTEAACFFELGFEVLGIGTEVEVEVEPNPRRWVSCPVVNLSSNASQSVIGWDITYKIQE
jgi:hypothetical protein